MRSGILSFEKKGYFNFTLLKKNLTRFWPLWAIYTGALFLSLDMPLINLENMLSNVNGVLEAPTAEFQAMYQVYMVEEYQDVVRTAMGVAVFLGAAYGCLLAMALFSYLMNRRSVGMLHALPIKREGLFLTNWITGAVFVVCPSLLAFLVALLTQVSKGAVGLEDLLLWLLVNISVTLFFFDFALCCAMFTGQLLALPVFYGILNGLVAGLYFLFGVAVDELVIGYAGGGFSTLFEQMIEWLTPIYFITDRVTRWDTVTLPDGGTRYSLLSGSLEGSAYAILVGCVLLLIAFWVYRTRQMERAEDLVTVSWVKPIFRYGVGVCTGLSLGTWLYVYFVDGGVWSYIILVTVCAVAGGFVGQMFLKKTLRVLRSGWKGSLALGLCVFLLLCGIRMDVGGFQSRVPEAEKVTWIELNGVRTQPSDSASWMSAQIRAPELIGQITQLHRSLVADLDKLEQAEREDWSYYGYDENSVSLWIQYAMEDGSRLVRDYDIIPISRDDLADPNSFASRLQALLEEPGMLWNNYLSWYWAEELDALSAVGGRIRNYGNYEDDLTLEYEEAQLLWAAIREDMDAGRYHRYLFYEEAGSFILDRQIELDLYGIRTDGENGERISERQTLQVTLQSTATSTLEALEKLGWDVETQVVEWDHPVG